MTQTTLKWNEWWKRWTDFSPKQLEAERLADKYGFLLYGGAAGGGKSYFLRKYPVKFLIGCFVKYKLRGVRAGLFCEDFPALHERHLNRLAFEFPSWLGRYRDKTHEYVLDEKYGGGVIAFRNLDDPSKYMSSEFALMAVDELTKNTKDVFDYLRLRKRWVGVKDTRFMAGTNPGGIGHDWVKRIWIDRQFDAEEQEKDDFVFLPAKAVDNPHLDDSYYTTLNSLPDKMRKAYRDGNWDVFVGQFFTEWDKSKHVTNPFPIPATWKRYRAYDHGREKPCCCKWYAVDYDGRIWVYREFYASGLNVDQIAKEIVRLSAGETYEYSVSDPAIFANIGMVDKSGGQTIAESFARNGVMFIPASNRRVDGWNIMHQYLYWDEQVYPKIIYFNTCFNSIRTIPNLIHDDVRPEDLDTQGEDHAADVDRYFLVSIHETRSHAPLTETEKKILAMKQKNTNLQSLYSGQTYRDSL
jgi:hypothetical protein